MLERMWSQGNTPPLLVGVQTCTAALESVWRFPRKWGINLPQDPVILLLGIYPKDAHSYYKEACSTVFTAALFVTARIQKQPRCPSAEE